MPLRHAPPIALAFAVSLGLVAVLPIAAGDTIVVNDVVTGSDTSLPVGASGTARVHVVASNNVPSGDLNGCNVAGGSQSARVYLNASAPSKVAMASPGYVTLDTCDTTSTSTIEGNRTLGYSVVGGSPGEVIVVYANATGGKAGARYANDSFTVTIAAPADSSPPQIAHTLSPASPDGANGWYRSAVTIDWTVTDGQSSVTSSSGCDDATLTADTTGTTRTCSATSAGGTNSSTTATIKIDRTAPSVSLVGGPAHGATYSPSTVPAAPTCDADDATSGLGTPPCAVEGYSDSVGTHTVTANATDEAGNANSTSATYTVADGSAPEIAYALAPAAPDGANGWYTSPISIDWSVYDNESSVTGSSGCDDGSVSADTSGTARTCSATSAGGTSNATTPTLKLDATAPSVSLIGGPSHGASYASGSVPAAPTCDADDATSGLPTPACTVAGYSTALGTHTVTANATDLAGNANSTSATYTVTDGTAPEIAFALSPSAPDGANGWYTSSVAVDWSVYENESTVTGSTGCDDDAIVLDMEAITLTCSATSEGGTTNASTPEIKRDATPPSVSLVGGPAHGATYGLGSVPAAPTCDASDATSGLPEPSCHVAGYSAARGTHTVTANATDLAGNANTSSATYTVVDDTPPAIAVALSPASPDGANGWYTGPVDVDWSVYENESSVTSATGCDDESLTEDTLGVARTCSATSEGGVGNASTPTIKLDATAPSVQLVGGPAHGGTYAYGSVPASPTCSASDAASGLPTPECHVSGYSAAIGTHTVTANATDLAGNANATSATYTVTDGTPPEIVHALSPAVPDGANGWYHTPISIDWTLHENESTVTSSTGCDDEIVSGDTAGATRTCSATSEGGTNASTTTTLKLDATPPSVSLVGGPADGGTYAWGAVPEAPTCAASDPTSGVPATPCTVSGYSGAAGTHTVTANATDLAGNANATSIRYTVTAWRTQGFYAPANDALNAVKGGSTVPLKFDLFAGATEITNTSGLSFQAVRVNCMSAAEDAIEELATTGGTMLRYDTVGGQFIQNWKTPAIPGACYKAVLSGGGIAPGAPIVANFRLK